MMANYNALHVLQTAQLCASRSHILEHPFFQSSMDVMKSGLSPGSEEYVLMVEEYFQNNMGLMRVPELLKSIYVIIGDPDKEFSIKNYGFLSFNGFKNRINIYRDVGQNKIADLAISNLGLGHICVLTMNLENGRVFFRYDGGSNGWERDDNWKWISNLDIKSILKSKQISLEHFFDGFEENTEICVN